MVTSAFSLHKSSLPPFPSYRSNWQQRIPRQNDTVLTSTHHVRPRCSPPLCDPRVRSRDISNPKKKRNDNNYHPNNQNHPPPPTTPPRLPARHPLRARRVVPNLPNPRRLFQHLRPARSAPQVLASRSRQRAPPQPLCAGNSLVSTHTSPPHFPTSTPYLLPYLPPSSPFLSPSPSPSFHPPALPHHPPFHPTPLLTLSAVYH